jgi:NTP pyrophosphatase (non-canonical NTP hydrolase)
MNELTKRVVAFREARNWKQFHNPKDLAISLNLEASELLELFQWKSSEDAISDKYNDLSDELADVFYYTLLMAHDVGIDLEKALLDKLEKNEMNYPVQKAFGSNKKYTEL